MGKIHTTIAFVFKILFYLRFFSYSCFRGGVVHSQVCREPLMPTTIPAFTPGRIWGFSSRWRKTGITGYPVVPFRASEVTAYSEVRFSNSKKKKWDTSSPQHLELRKRKGQAPSQQFLVVQEHICLPALQKTASEEEKLPSKTTGN